MQQTISAPAPGQTLRQAMQSRTVGLPGAFNGLVARAAARAGFEGLYVSGAAVTASWGVPDIGLLTLDEFTCIIRQVVTGSALPVIADADTGFGETEMIRRTVAEYHRAGGAGFHIEDQVFPKRCGHLDGKTLVPGEEFAMKVSAAADARDTLTGGDFIVCARTDAAGVEGLDSAIRRAALYVEAGADMIFPEGLTSEQQFADFAKAMRTLAGDAPGGGPFVLANMTEFGKTPLIPLSRFAELGCHCVIWPVSTLRSAMGEVRRLLQTLASDGGVGAHLQSMLTRAELYDLLGYTPGTEWRFPGPSGGRDDPPH